MYAYVHYVYVLLARGFGNKIKIIEHTHTHTHKYVDAIRMVYDGLLCMEVSTRNIEGVIRSVLKTVGINLGQLPR